MNNDLDALLKLIIPAIFLIVWAISQLANREEPQPKPRPLPRGGGGLPPRPLPGPRPREAGGPREQPPMRWGEPAEPLATVPQEPEPRRGPAPPDEIVILGTEIRPPRPTPHRPASRGSSRPRPAPGSRRTPQTPAPIRPEPITPPHADLSGLGSLTTPIQPFATGAQGRPLPIATPAAAPGPPTIAPMPITEQVRGALGSPERVREALVLNELLAPPLALRRRPGPRG